jgi:hypothetical protein
VNAGAAIVSRSQREGLFDVLMARTMHGCCLLVHT